MTDFEKLRKDLASYDVKREELIKKSRDILKLSKLLIYSVHRDELEKATDLLTQIEKEIANLNEISSHDNKLLYEGSYKIAIQEYVEAVLYYHFVKSGQLIDLDVFSEHYMLGLADLPGELNRRAVYLAGKGKVQDVVKIKEMVDSIYGQLLKFDFRQSEIRRKVDAVKYELRKLEDLVLDLKLKDKL